MPDTAFVLIVEDDLAHGEAIAEALRSAGHIPRVVSSGNEAIESLQQRPPDVVITDYKLGGQLNGLDVLRAAKRLVPDCEVILITAYGSEQLARDTLARDGPYQAYDYLIKPLDLSVLREKVNRAARQALTARDNRRMQDQLQQAFSFEGLVGSSETLAREIKRVQKLARSKSTVLIVGESGTGKELIAQAIHVNSPRKNSPFKVINCAALSETLLESELFGHVKGAFTGAIQDHKGLLVACDGGTLFLDEIGDMPHAMQAKLLRTLETGEVTPVGSTETRYVDVRFVAATHRDLTQLIKEGSFREDLYYRLHAHGAIRLPPLRERREDIPLLVRHFINLFNRENHTKIRGVTPDGLRKLTQHNWPGNVRELRNVVERMCVEAEGDELTVQDLPENLRAVTDIVPVGLPALAGMSMADVERLHILNTLKLCGGNRERTAKVLKIGARTLYRKLKDYGIT
ncbi:MAG TPA: sigma-54 dependent transcriptional regulator [Phycisphaerae bacterium]|jgi:two-component system response regulator HydG